MSQNGGPLRPPVPFRHAGSDEPDAGHDGAEPGFASAAADPATGDTRSGDTRSGDTAVDAAADRWRPRTRPRRSPLTGLAIAAMVLAAVLYLYGGAVGGHQMLIGIPMIPVFVALLLPLLNRLRTRERGFDLAGLLLLSFGLKLVAAYFRFITAVDAREYNRVGAWLAGHFRRFEFFVDTGREVPGTGTVRYVTGLVHLATGSTFFATFLIFTFISLFGLYFFYRAFETGLPEGDHRRYAYLIFLWPSMLFWPSSLGKEALITTALGLTAWGTARIVEHQRGGLSLAAAGGLATMMVRPHVAMIALVAMVAALLMRRSDGDQVARLTAKLFLLGVVVVGGALLTSAAAEFLDLESLALSEVTAALETTVGMTSTGGSAFAPARIASPVDLPWAFITVLFRPFPGEAGGLEGLLTGFEGVVLIGLLVAAIGRLGRAPRGILTRAYVMYAASYVVVFVFVFSVIANFGILARQRTQVLPLLFVLLALPVARRHLASRTRPVARVRISGRTS